MSTIQSSSALLGCRSALRWGTARCNTVRSIATNSVGSASTASPAHSRRVARGGGRRTRPGPVVAVTAARSSGSSIQAADPSRSDGDVTLVVHAGGLTTSNPNRREDSESAVLPVAEHPVLDRAVTAGVRVGTM